MPHRPDDDTDETERQAPHRSVGPRTLAMLREMVLTERERDTVVPDDEAAPPPTAPGIVRSWWGGVVDTDVTETDVKLARIRAGNHRLAIIGLIFVALATVVVYGGRSLSLSMWGSEMTIADKFEAAAAEDAAEAEDTAAVETD